MTRGKGGKDVMPCGAGKEIIQTVQFYFKESFLLFFIILTNIAIGGFNLVKELLKLKLFTVHLKKLKLCLTFTTTIIHLCLDCFHLNLIKLLTLLSVSL